MKVTHAFSISHLEDVARDVALEGDNPLLTSAVSLLSLVPKLRNTAFYDAVDMLQEHLVADIKKFESSALEKGLARNQVDVAKYLLCALLDETVLNTPWGSQSGWGHNSLSSLFYRKLVGGEEFFQILHHLKQEHAQNIHLLELVYYCLSMGFEGKYRYIGNGLATLEKERQELYILLQRLKGDAKPELSIHWQGGGNRQNPLIRLVPLWVLGGVAGVLLMLIYMILAVSIGDQSDRVYDRLVKISQTIAGSPQAQSDQTVAEQRSSTSLIERLQQSLADEVRRHQVAVIDGPIIRIFNMFPSGSAEVRNEYQAVISKIALTLAAETPNITIIGHTDNQKLKFATRFKSNWHLSRARAESTATMLQHCGLATDRMRVEAMADKDPIVDNGTEENRSLNRRIDIHIR